MSKKKDIVEERIKENKNIREGFVKKGIKSVDEKIKSSEFIVESMIANTILGYTYHDLIDSKDKLNSKYQRKYNQTYHNVDVELYKINRKIDRKIRMIDYDANNKKDKLFKKIKKFILKK